jgi:uncharacterized protein
MEPSVFNVRVPFEDRGEVFLMNTLTDAQLIVSSDVAALLDRHAAADEIDGLSDEERGVVELLRDHGFLVANRAAERQALDDYMDRACNDASELNVTVLTTLQCNFACGYCYQGDRDDFNKFAEKMTLDTSARVAGWIAQKLEVLEPKQLVLTFFGGEPLLNLPVLYDLAERVWRMAAARDVTLHINLITNGLLLTPDVIDRLEPYGLFSVKVTLDGDRDAHNRLRPLRGGQGTFDRIIQNISQIAGRVKVAIGGNFDETSVDSYPALLDFLKQQSFGDQLVKVNFKPILRTGSPQPKGALPLLPVDASGKPLNGTCLTSVGAGGGLACDTCAFLDDKMNFLRSETKRRGLPTPDGVHGGPCHVHHKHAYTVGPDGALYGCPGFTGEHGLSVGHIDGRVDPWREANRERFDRLNPWEQCGDCAFIPVCAGGCLVASHTQLGDMNAPTCHKPSFESALIALANDVAGASRRVE